MRLINVKQLKPNGDVSKEVSLKYCLSAVKTVVEGGDLFSELQQLAADNVATKQTILSHEAVYTKPMIMDLFPEDSHFTLRVKVAAALGIPIYRVFMFTKEYQFYRITTAYGLTIVVDPNELITPIGDRTHDVLFNTVVDPEMVKADKKLIIKSHEMFKTLESSTMSLDELFVVDFADFLTPIWDTVASAAEQQRRYWYMGFVNKFWPMITEDFFNYIITGRESLIEGEVPEWTSAFDRTFKQVEILKMIHAAAGKKDARKIRESIPMAITNAITSVPNPQTKINLLSLFSHISTNMNVPIIKLFVPQIGQSLIKTFPQAEIYGNVNKIKLPSEFKRGIVFGIWIDVNQLYSVIAGKQLIFINIDTKNIIYVYVNWREDYGITYEKHYALIDRFVNPIIHQINNNYGYYMHNQLNLIKPEYAKFDKLTVMLYWQQIVTEAQFSDIKKMLSRDTGCGLFEYNRFSNISTKETVNLDFVKGGSHRDPDLITYRMPKDQYNYYSWMWNPQIRTIYTLLYKGFGFKILHRSNDLRIEITNVTVTALELFKIYISAYFSQIDTSKVANVKEYKRKITKLNHMDPVLFKFMKEDEKGKKQNYSILCQEKKQPVIYNQDEISRLSDKKKKKLVEYWNFTYNRPSYYECPSAEFPHFGFLIGKHPDGFCLACCQKLDPSFKPEYSECLKHDVDQKIEKSSKSARHIMIYRDMQVDPGRLSQIPAVARLLNNDNIYLFGVNQTLRGVGRVGLLESILLLMDKTVEAFLDSIRSSITDAYLWKDIYELFYMHNVNHIFTSTIQEMNEAWIDAIKNVYDVNVVIIDLNTGVIRSGIDTNSRNILINKKSNDIYEPIVAVDLSTYFSAIENAKITSSSAIKKRIFDKKEVFLLIEKAIQRRGIDYSKTPSTVVSSITIAGFNFGHVYKLADGSLMHLPQEFHGDTDAKAETITKLPQSLSWPALRDFMLKSNIIISHGIKAEGKVKIVVDNFQRIYFIDEAVDKFEFPIGDNWHYSVEEIFAALLVTDDKTDQTKIFKQNLLAADNAELYKQMSFRYLIYLFILVLSRYQNRELRAEIMERIKTKTAPINQMKIPRSDIEDIYRLMGQYYTSINRGQYGIIEQAINDYRFMFDELFLEGLRRKNTSDLKVIIMDMLDSYIRIDPNAQKTKLRLFHSLDFYERNPLIIHDEAMIDLMVKWFVNPMLRRYFNIHTFDSIFDDNMRNIDLTKIVVKPGERFDIEVNEEVDEEGDLGVY